MCYLKLEIKAFIIIINHFSIIAAACTICDVLLRWIGTGIGTLRDANKLLNNLESKNWLQCIKIPSTEKTSIWKQNVLRLHKDCGVGWELTVVWINGLETLQRHIYLTVLKPASNEHLEYRFHKCAVTHDGCYFDFQMKGNLPRLLITVHFNVEYSFFRLDYRSFIVHLSTFYWWKITFRCRLVINHSKWETICSSYAVNFWTKCNFLKWSSDLKSRRKDR